ncbi:uncharacterized protein LOC111696566 [Eurytemora carolleeae]|uniref:uncharacterized protein LOC111696566 n=1 Tax=Eurytemora carolleeae TaxID=1294199 RepID=UPI000C75B2CF|nr:uncharacterized protein LOC111696566 [Eurytemora carolleeae]|eukprot:XP_023321969.1 uncharacterized protein LOC111696566 [Eurytemora affinis]
MVRFDNGPCNATETETGICYTHEQCDEKGGIQTQSCAAGFGVCCLFRGSCYDRVAEAKTYFSNPSWPLADTSNSFCTYSLVVSDPDVCQIRLDFELFEMAPPSLTHSPIGECDGDRLAIFTSQQNLGLYQGNTVCGNLTGQHMYIPVNATAAEDPVRLFAFVGQSGSSFRWNIKSSLIDCSKNNDLQAPDGCLQYFTESTGSIESLNYGSGAGSPYLAGTQYFACIKRQTGFCGVKIISSLGEFIMNSDLGTNIVPPGEGYNCASGDTVTGNNDYISALGSWSMNNTIRVPDTFYCGGTATTTFPEINIGGGPLMLFIHTDDGVRYATGELFEAATSLNDTLLQENIINERERGFRLTYTLQPCGYTSYP